MEKKNAHQHSHSCAWIIIGMEFYDINIFVKMMEAIENVKCKMSWLK